MRLTRWLLLLQILAVMITFAYCQDVHYNYDRRVDFTSYKTYEWVELSGPDGVLSDELIDQDIKRAVDEQLAQKGLIRVDKDGNFEVGYHAILREEKNINLNTVGTGGPWGWGGWGRIQRRHCHGPDFYNNIRHAVD